MSREPREFSDWTFAECFDSLRDILLLHPEGTHFCALEKKSGFALNAEFLLELLSRFDELQQKLEKWGNCLQWINSGVCGMFGSPDKTWHEEAQELIPDAIDKVMSDEDWEGITNSQVARLRRERDEWKAQALHMAEALKEAGHFCQDVLARVNQAISTDCPDCDYQCQGCLRSVDDCESTKIKINEALARFAEFKKEKG